VSANRKFDLDDYIPVKERIELFWAKYPNGSIKTELLHADETYVRVYAAAFADVQGGTPRLLATGLAEEKREGYINRDSAMENAESSAIGRCLANAGFATSRGPSREEMAKVKRLDDHRNKKAEDIPMEPASIMSADEAKQVAAMAKEWMGEDSSRQANFKLKIVELGAKQTNKPLWQVVAQLTPQAAVDLNTWMGQQDG